MSATESTGRVPSAMRSPLEVAIPRRSPSIRRTSHIDMLAEAGSVDLRGAARDLVTFHDGAHVLGDAQVHAVVGTDGCLAQLETGPTRDAATTLLGRPVSRGFRDAVHAALPDEVAAGTPLYMLLDDLPVATLISGYALLYRGEMRGDPGSTQSLKSDICSGWREDGSMMVSVRAGRGVPVTVGPPAPEIENDVRQDPLGWHELGPLPLGAMRRKRLVDLHPVGADEDGAARWEISAMFRDTHVDPSGGGETVLHEYTLSATVDPTSGVLTSCEAVPRVLPWVECPVAAASADQLTGRTVADVRDVVRRELRGTRTCTHLNDLLRSLGDLEQLARSLGSVDVGR